MDTFPVYFADFFFWGGGRHLVPFQDKYGVDTSMSSSRLSSKFSERGLYYLALRRCSSLKSGLNDHYTRFQRHTYQTYGQVGSNYVLTENEVNYTSKYCLQNRFQLQNEETHIPGRCHCVRKTSLSIEFHHVLFP